MILLIVCICVICLEKTFERGKLLSNFVDYRFSDNLVCSCTILWKSILRDKFRAQNNKHAIPVRGKQKHSIFSENERIYYDKGKRRMEQQGMVGGRYQFV